MERLRVIDAFGYANSKSYRRHTARRHARCTLEYRGDPRFSALLKRCGFALSASAS